MAAPAVRKLEVPVRLVLIAPPSGCDFGVQRGRGTNYETISVQRYSGRDLIFDFSLSVDAGETAVAPNFLGPFAQGPANGRFVYIDVGTYAGQKDSAWSRRMKIPLAGISWTLIRQAAERKGRIAARIPGTGRDGGPSCATTQPLGAWTVLES